MSGTDGGNISATRDWLPIAAATPPTNPISANSSREKPRQNPRMAKSAKKTARTTSIRSTSGNPRSIPSSPPRPPRLPDPDVCIGDGGSARSHHRRFLGRAVLRATRATERALLRSQRLLLALHARLLVVL